MKKNKFWFKRKKYGWGWTPSSAEGWLILLAFIVSIVWIFSSVDEGGYSGSDILINLAPRFIILSVILIVICYVKGEKPKWSWGDNKS